MAQAGQYHEGHFSREFHGRQVDQAVILCCPGDWPEILEQIPEAERDQWSTCRLGVHLVALGPPILPWLDVIIERADAADGVAALDRGGV